MKKFLLAFVALAFSATAAFAVMPKQKGTVGNICKQASDWVSVTDAHKNTGLEAAKAMMTALFATHECITGSGFPVEFLEKVQEITKSEGNFPTLEVWKVQPIDAGPTNTTFGYVLVQKSGIDI